MIPLMNTTGEYYYVKQEIDEVICQVLNGGQYILGPNVEMLEEEMAHYCGVSCGVGVASGTDALILGLLACGIGEGDEVITTPFTFFATAEAITLVGAVPVFVDIEPGTFNLDPGLVEKKITPRTRAIVPVHIFGQMADMERITAVAQKYDLFVIEDACQAAGAEQRGRRAGSFGDLACFSFFPTKNLGGFGDGGIVVTGDEQRARQIKKLRVHGSEKKYYHSCVGFNSRLDELQAAVLRVKLGYLDTFISSRNKNARLYDSLFSAGEIRSPRVEPFNTHTYHLYTIRTEKRAQVYEALKAKGIGCGIYYPLPLHLQKALAFLGYRQGDFPEAEKASREVLSLPVHPFLTIEQVEHVAGTVLQSV